MFDAILDAIINRLQTRLIEHVAGTYGPMEAWPDPSSLRADIYANIDLSALTEGRVGFTVGELQRFLSASQRLAMDAALDQPENTELRAKVRLAEISGQRFLPDSETFDTILMLLEAYSIITTPEMLALLNALGVAPDPAPEPAP